MPANAAAAKATIAIGASRRVFEGNPMLQPAEFPARRTIAGGDDGLPPFGEMSPYAA